MATLGTLPGLTRTNSARSWGGQINRRDTVFALLAVWTVPLGALAQQALAQPRGVYATIDMRSAHAMVSRLRSSSGAERKAAVREVLEVPSAQMPLVLYALANALSSELSRAEDAVFWYHVGRLRAVYDALRCKDVSARREVTVLGQTLSRDLRAAQFYHRDGLVAIAEKAIEWDSKHPHAYDHRWINLSGIAAASSDGTDPDALTVPESEWPAILQRVHETHLKSVQDFAAKKEAY